MKNVLFLSVALCLGVVAYPSYRHFNPEQIVIDFKGNTIRVGSLPSMAVSYAGQTIEVGGADSAINMRDDGRFHWNTVGATIENATFIGEDK